MLSDSPCSTLSIALIPASKRVLVGSEVQSFSVGYNTVEVENNPTQGHNYDSSSG